MKNENLINNSDLKSDLKKLDSEPVSVRKFLFSLFCWGVSF